MRIKKKHATRIVSGALCAALVVSALSGCVASSSSTSAEANGVDGTYTATAAGFGGDVTVTVTVKNGEITDAKAEGASETANVGGAAIEQFNAGKLGELAGLAADAELSIDGYSGATVTSTALKNCLKDIHSQITGDAAEEKTPLKAGTYTEMVYGNNYSIPFEVTVTLGENSIEKIEVTDHGGETEEILQTAIDKLIPRIEEHQSLAVDAVTGATASSGGIKTAVANAINEAGGDARQWYDSVEKKTDTVVLDDYDVIVVGLGGSGMSAYCSAAETGAAVIGVEAAAKVGGASVTAGGPLAVNPENSEVQPEAGTEGYPVDADALENDWMEDTKGQAKQSCVELLINKSGETLDWLIEKFNFAFTKVTTFMGYNYQVYASYDTSDGTTKTQFYTRALDSAGKNNEKDQYLLETKAEQILTDENGNVCGVRAVGYDGTTYEIYAPSVILCTGGYGGNAELTKENLGSTMSLIGMYQNDGTMLQSAINDCGAATYNMDTPGMSHAARTATDLRSTEVEPSHQKTLDAIVTSSDALLVGEDGTRFCQSDDVADITENAHLAGDYYYAIVSEKYLNSIKENGLKEVYPMLNTQDESIDMAALMAGDMPMGAAPAGAEDAASAEMPAGAPAGADAAQMPQSAPAADNSAADGKINKSDYMLKAGDPITDMDKILELGANIGIVYEADSIEELAKMIGADQLTATVQNYNEYCTSGVDPEFSKNAENMISLDDGSTKYYAIKAKNYCYSTCGGLDVNENIEVLDTEGNAIPGLYACGTDSMGVLLNDEVGYLDYGGVAHGWCFTSGKQAGKNAVEYANSKKA